MNVGKSQITLALIPTFSPGEKGKRRAFMGKLRLVALVFRQRPKWFLQSKLESSNVVSQRENEGRRWFGGVKNTLLANFPEPEESEEPEAR